MTGDGPAYVILGATGGIGSELCRRLAARGARLLLAARDADRLRALAGELNAVHATVDATKPADVDAAFAQASEAFGPLAGAANCVGSILLKPAHLTTDAEWAETLALNLSSAFYTVRAAAKAMQSTGGGSIALCSTVAASVGLANHEAIAAAKGGVNGLVLAAAASYAARGIRVNAVAPGLVKTPLTARLTSSEASLKASTAMHPIGRVGEPADVAAALAWLLDPATSWVTGQVIGVDGGMSTVRPR